MNIQFENGAYLVGESVVSKPALKGKRQLVILSEIRGTEKSCWFHTHFMLYMPGSSVDGVLTGYS